MLKELKELFEKKHNSPSNNESFVRLIQLMDADKGFQAMILKLINLDSFNRSSKINSIISDLKLQKAPSDHIQILNDLIDDEICEKIKSMQK